MRHNTALTTPVALLALAFVVGSLSIAQADEHRECSNATLNSSYGFVATGTLLALPAPFAGPFGEIGRQTFDGRGNTAGTGTLSANGNIVRVTVEGTYEVNPDCTGSMALFILPFAATATFDFVIDDDGAEIGVIATDPGAVETRVYREKFRKDRRGK